VAAADDDDIILCFHSDSSLKYSSAAKRSGRGENIPSPGVFAPSWPTVGLSADCNQERSGSGNRKYRIGWPA
ncbi:MAG: hypothetical protein KAJ81_03870, partial [Candidatus Latescibacteria bacterium]|nr:hypothetical protein [Candidatus Latescibacterota bacterium]